MKPDDCTATEQASGTDSGYRSGCRCRACRTAHTKVSRKSRALVLTDEQRGKVITGLLAGTDPAKVADQIGVSARRMESLIRDDDALTAAWLSSEGWDATLLKQANYLYGLMLSGGKPGRASEHAKVTRMALLYWRQHHPGFVEAENAVRTYSHDHARVNRERREEADRDRKRCQRAPIIVEKHGDEIRRMWDENVPPKEIAARLGIHRESVSRARKALGLPARGSGWKPPGWTPDNATNEEGEQ